MHVNWANFACSSFWPAGVLWTTAVNCSEASLHAPASVPAVEAWARLLVECQALATQHILLMHCTHLRPYPPYAILCTMMTLQHIVNIPHSLP